MLKQTFEPQTVINPPVFGPSRHDLDSFLAQKNYYAEFIKSDLCLEQYDTKSFLKLCLCVDQSTRGFALEKRFILKNKLITPDKTSKADYQEVDSLTGKTLNKELKSFIFEGYSAGIRQVRIHDNTIDSHTILVLDAINIGVYVFDNIPKEVLLNMCDQTTHRDEASGFSINFSLNERKKSKVYENWMALQPYKKVDYKF